MLSEIYARLTDTLTDQRWAGVSIAEDIDALRDLAGQVESGTAIIMPFREQAGEQSLMSGGFRQRVEVQFLIGTVIRLYDQSMGAERALMFDAYKSDIEQAIAGWAPPSCVELCELVGGESSPVKLGVSIYAQTWATARFLTGEAP